MDEWLHLIIDSIPATPFPISRITTLYRLAQKRPFVNTILHSHHHHRPWRWVGRRKCIDPAGAHARTWEKNLRGVKNKYWFPPFHYPFCTIVCWWSSHPFNGTLSSHTQTHTWCRRRMQFWPWHSWTVQVQLSSNADGPGWWKEQESIRWLTNKRFCKG